MQKNWGPKLIEALVARQPELANEDNLAIFKRKWEYMCVYAEIGFARAYTSCHQFTFARPVSNVAASQKLAKTRVQENIVTLCD